MVRPSILVVGNFLSSKGNNLTVAEDLSQHLKDVGYLVTTTSEVRSRLLRLLDILKTIYFQRTTYQIACVEVYSGGAFIWAAIACRLLGILKKPYILTLHGGNLPAFARNWPGHVHQLLKGAIAVTAPSPYLREEMSFLREDILLIPNPVDIINYSFRSRSMAGHRLVWLRAFHKMYNPQMAPLVIANLRSAFPDIFLTMIGPDKGDGALQETKLVIEKLGLQKNIEIVPGIPKNKVPEYLKQPDIFINTTNIDNTPVSVLEAMACGLCIVSTNVGGIPYLLVDGQDALLVPPDDTEATANAVKRIWTEPGLVECLSKNARKKAEQFDWSVILPQWEDLLNRGVTS